VLAVHDDAGARGMQDEALNSGDKLGRYRLIRPVASGGMATVWAARLAGKRGFNKLVAVKTMLPVFRREPEAERMFVQEAALTARVHHPNVVEVLDLGDDKDVVYIVMEWIQGEPLSVITRAAPGGRIPFAAAVRIVSQTCAGLHAAHEVADDKGSPVGLVHRDVSPHNVLVGFDGLVKVVDFGIAKAEFASSERTAPGALKGKLAYMAPEQIRFESVDRRTDVFAAGIVLYLLTTGVHPFRREDPSETVRAILSPDAVESPRSFISNYPRRLEQVVMTALAKEPHERFATAAGFAQALAEAVPPSVDVHDRSEVAGYVRALVPERVAFHETLVRQANEADEPSGSVPSVIVRKPTAQSNSTLRAVAVSRSPGSVTPLQPRPAPTLPPRTRRRRVSIAVALATTAVAVGGALMGSRGREPEPALGSAAPMTVQEARSRPPPPVPLAPSAAPEPPASPPEAEAPQPSAVPQSAPVSAPPPVRRALKPAVRPPVRDLKDPYGQ
jgi:serine/threonine-protein kinase